MVLFHNHFMACCSAFLQDFEQDAFDFQQKVEDIDRRLATIFIQAFDDALDLEHAFKVFMSHPFCRREIREPTGRLCKRRAGSTVPTGTWGWCLLTVGQ